MVDVIHGFYFLYKHPCRESHPDVTFLLDCDFLTMVHILDLWRKHHWTSLNRPFRSIQATSHKQRHPENTTTRRRCVREHIQSAKIGHWFHHGWISSDGFSKGWTSSKTPRTCGTSATNNAGPAKEASHPGKGCIGCKRIYIQPHFQRRLSTKSMDSKLVAIQTAIMNIMPASANQYRQNEEVHAVYSPRSQHQRTSNNQFPRRRGPCLRYGYKTYFNNSLYWF